MKTPVRPARETAAKNLRRRDKPTTPVHREVITPVHREVITPVHREVITPVHPARDLFSFLRGERRRGEDPGSRGKRQFSFCGAETWEEKTPVRAA